MVISEKDSAITINWDSKSDRKKGRPPDSNYHKKATHPSIQTRVSAWWALMESLWCVDSEA